MKETDSTETATGQAEINPEDSADRRPIWQKILLGLAAGGGGGLIGVGGGVVLVPVLTYWGLTQRRAQGTSLVVIAVIAPLAIVGYFLNGNMDFGFAIPLAIGGALGSLAGSNLAQRFPNRLLARMFGGFLVLVAFRMLFIQFGANTDGHELAWLEWVEVGLFGVLAGFVAGFFGVGGGVVFVPTGVLLGGLEQVIAQGSSFVAIFPTSALAARAYSLKGEIDWRMAGWLIPSALVGVLIGAYGADLISGNYLRYTFACYLLYTGLRRMLSNKR